MKALDKLREILMEQRVMEFLVLSLLVYIVLDALILAWFFAAPYVVQSENRFVFGFGMLAYNVGYLLSNCHQMPQRTVFLDGFPFPFCARDLGIYIGCFIGGILPFMKLRMSKALSSIPVSIALLIPLVVDGVSQTILRLRESSNTLRLVTGLLFGFAMVYFFAERIVKSYAKSVDFFAEAKRAASIGVVFLVALSVGAYIVSDDYLTLNEAVNESGLNPSFVTYVSARSFSTLRADPYFSSYDDAVFDALLRHRFHGYGVWVVYEGDMIKDGKYVYFSGGSGNLSLIPDTNSI